MNAQKRGTQVDKAALYRRIILPIRSDKAFKELFNCSPVYEVQFYNYELFGKSKYVNTTSVIKQL